jgi:RNA polymerase sigma factor (sigma-70 family)
VTDVVDGAFRRHYATVYRYIRRRTGDDDRAEDLTQEVFAAAAAALPTEGDGRPPILAWLYTVAQRRFADAARRSARRFRRCCRADSRRTTRSRSGARSLRRWDGSSLSSVASWS